MTVLQFGEHLAEHFEELQPRHVGIEFSTVLCLEVSPLEAQLLLLVGEEAVALVDNRPESIEVALRRLVEVVIALLAGQKKKEKGKE